MVTMQTAYTTEIDEIDDAMNEILGQLDMTALRKNSVGIVTCHFDFVEAGLIAELSARLPFDVIGMTTMASGNEHGFDMYGLSLAVLTSDDVVFETAITAPFGTGDYKEKLAETYAETRSKLQEDPSLIISFFPYLRDISGAVLVKYFDELCGGVPTWGSLSTNTDISYDHCRSIRNDVAERDALVMLLLRGPVDPEFVVVSIPEQKIRANRGVITESDDCVLKKVNNLPVLEYFKTMGVELLPNAANATPIMVYYEDNTEPVALGIFTIREDGSFLCGGEMTEGASISIGEITAEGILATARDGVRHILQSGRHNGALMLPCVTRYVMLAPDQKSEIRLVSRLMGENASLPYMMGYSGGEVCPVRDETGKTHNRFHNYTFSACVF
ncbi:hypothetical protein FACS1894206_02900 [Deltaproteobacteria bacterium]|nr:hypothetical protein FACS1894206_02900 [Deltaproteobacteria bacterium]